MFALVFERVESIASRVLKLTIYRRSENVACVAVVSASGIRARACGEKEQKIGTGGGGGGVVEPAVEGGGDGASNFFSRHALARLPLGSRFSLFKETETTATQAMEDAVACNWFCEFGSCRSETF